MVFGGLCFGACFFVLFFGSLVFLCFGICLVGGLVVCRLFCLCLQWLALLALHCVVCALVVLLCCVCCCVCTSVRLVSIALMGFDCFVCVCLILIVLCLCFGWFMFVCVLCVTFAFALIYLYCLPGLFLSCFMLFAFVFSVVFWGGMLICFCCCGLRGV